MKKRVLAMVLALGMTFGLAGCAGSDKAADTSDKKAESADTESKDELTTVKWNYGSSGNVLVTIAEEEGYFEDEGIKDRAGRGLHRTWMLWHFLRLAR